jgi:competence protein ComEA
VERISEYLREFWWIGLIGVVGLGIVGYGMWGVMGGERASVEIIRGKPSRSDLVGSENDMQPTRSDLIYVDIAGAVERPGVYKLPSGSRIGDALVMAGGLSAKADREWVAKTINLASEVKDGGKVYIPAISQISDSVSQKVGGSVSQSGKVNINTASMGELDGLPEIGESRARAIIDNRPYGSIEEIVAKAKVPQSVYEAIKDSLSIY